MGIHEQVIEKNAKSRDIREMDFYEAMLFELKCIRMHLEVLSDTHFDKTEVE